MSGTLPIPTVLDRRLSDVEQLETIRFAAKTFEAKGKYPSWPFGPAEGQTLGEWTLELNLSDTATVWPSHGFVAFVDIGEVEQNERGKWVPAEPHVVLDTTAHPILSSDLDDGDEARSCRGDIRNWGDDAAVFRSPWEAKKAALYHLAKYGAHNGGFWVIDTQDYLVLRVAVLTDGKDLRATLDTLMESYR